MEVLSRVCVTPRGKGTLKINLIPQVCWEKHLKHLLKPPQSTSVTVEHTFYYRFIFTTPRAPEYLYIRRRLLVLLTAAWESLQRQCYVYNFSVRCKLLFRLVARYSLPSWLIIQLNPKETKRLLSCAIDSNIKTSLNRVSFTFAERNCRIKVVQWKASNNWIKFEC